MGSSTVSLPATTRKTSQTTLQLSGIRRSTSGRRGCPSRLSFEDGVNVLLTSAPASAMLTLAIVTPFGRGEPFRPRRDRGRSAFMAPRSAFPSPSPKAGGSPYNAHQHFSTALPRQSRTNQDATAPTSVAGRLSPWPGPQVLVHVLAAAYRKPRNVYG